MSSRAVPPAPPFGGARRFRDFGLAPFALAFAVGVLALAIATSRVVIAEPSRHSYVPVGGSTGWPAWLVLAGLALLGSLAVALLARSRADRMRLRALARQMDDTAGTDWLTGLYNRRALSEQLARAGAYARRHGEPVSVLMVHLDNLTATNERFGWETGDEILRAVAQCMRAECRGDDVCGRWDGDEFLIIMPAIDELAVKIAAERLRDTAAGLDLGETAGGTGVRLSVGTATGVHTTPDALERAASFDLQQAKSAKRAARASAAAA